MVKLNRNDLEFILKQIKIAEAHTAAINGGADPRAALEQLVSSPLLPYGLRTVDGSFNNFQPNMTQFGSSDETMVRLLTPNYAPAEINPRNGQQTSYADPTGSVYDSQPRLISNIVADQSLNNPAAIAAALASVDIKGAEALGIVRTVMDLQAAARAAHAAVANAAANAAAAVAAADIVVANAQATQATAQSTYDAAVNTQAAAVQTLASANAALSAAVAARDAHAPVLANAQAAAATALAASQAAAAAVSLATDERDVAFANLALAQQAESAALATFQANPTPANGASYLAAVDARQDAQIAYDTSVENLEDASAALSAAQAGHATAVATLQDAVAEQQTLTNAVDAAQGTASSATAALSNADAALGVAAADLANATTALDDAIDARAAILTGNAATAAAQALAEAADAAVIDELSSHGVTMDGDNVFIKNIAADLGDTASFNGFMTIFGQFFDHGLDLTTKGGSGNVIIPLQPDDPLYVPGSPTNFMILTRATNDPGPDGQLGTADDIRDHQNETTPWIDLNQVYTSNPSHQAFLREYVLVDGKPLATGQMLQGATGGPPTWADIKNQARDLLGIELSDMNVHSVPLLVTDLYGEFVRGPNGLPLMMTATGPVEGNLAAPVAGLTSLSAGRAFLNDIAHSAVPSGPVDHDRNPMTAPVPVLADADDITGNPILPNAFGVNTTYDDELLDAHFVVGDGRGNENIALTATHSVFHSEHNRQVNAIKATVLAEGDLAMLNEWLLVDVAAFPSSAAGLVWDGERLFQAARFSTEMVYQHLVFEEFVRAVAPQIDAFVFSHSVELDGAIFEEFAQVVYRFGHSMLAENVEMLTLNAQGVATPQELGLIEAFLNPVAFNNAGVDAHAASGAIIRGMTYQAGNEIDEFLTSALRNNLVGLPLDLAAVNIARARETGIPSLNEARRQIYEQTQDSYLKPYESWADFAQHIKNPLSIVNFIAAYGTHETVVAATTAEAKRDAAWDLVFGAAGETTAERQARLDYLNATGTWAARETGLNKVDFWIGGLAEALMPFGGMLGSTFTFVFELQIQNLQNGDRFYYLSRTQGQNLLNELEADSFADLIRRNTDTEDTGLHINGSAFQTADYIITMDQTKQWNHGLGNADPTREADVISAVTGTDSLVVRGTNYLRFTGEEHVVLGGTNAGETLIGGAGDDTIWGEGGDDRIEGGFGVDHLHGGDGDDIITDSGTDIGAGDVIKGEGGDDVINGGMGLDLIFGGAGNDVLAGGEDVKTISGGEGHDFIRAPTGGGTLLGNEGDDWMEAQGNMTTLTGDNSELFFNSRIIGHDVMIAGENDTDFDGESGDDIMVQGIGINRSNGMAGFDWTTFKNNNYDADANMNISIFVNQQNNILRDRYDLVEGLSGWDRNDTLTGRDVVIGGYDPNGNAAQVDVDAPIESFSNALLEKNVDRIAGLRELVAHLQRFDLYNPHNLDANGAPINPAGPKEIAVMDTSDGSDILLGGGGSDTIRGMGGNDIIDGDKWLNGRILVSPREGQAWSAFSIDSIAQIQTRLFSGEIKPSQLQVVREIIDGGNAGDVDTAVYYDNFENYEITFNADGSVTVAHTNPTVGVIDPVTGRNLEAEGTDRLFNIERIQFADRILDLRGPSIDLHAFERANYVDAFGTANYANSNGSASWASAWTETGDRTTNVATTGEIRINGGQLEFRQDTGAGSTPAGATITRAVDLSMVGAGTATLSFNYEESGLDNGETLQVQFSGDGTNFSTIMTITGASNDGTANLSLAGPFTATSAIRFVFSGVNANTETVRIDNVNVEYTTPVDDGTTAWSATFTENQAAVGISSLSGITTDETIVSARVVLKNMAAGDTLTATTANGRPAAIAVSQAVIAGELVLQLTGAATAADYQRALDAVRFSNTSDNPGTTPRTIEVTVNDGIRNSQPATATISVVAIDDPMIANNDRVVTNWTNGNPFTIPSWALLANDVDPDSALAISAITQATSLAATLGPDGITVNDNGVLVGGSFTYRGTGTDTATVDVVRDILGTIDGGTGNDILVGDDAANTLNGNAGNDIVFAGGGNDTINQSSTQGRDIIDGGAGSDTYVLSGSAGAELFRIYAVTAGQNATLAANLNTTFLTSTEIVITRTVGGVESVIAELDNIEEITVNTLNVTNNNNNGGPDQGLSQGDTIQVIGNFDTTSLNYSTITVEGSAGNDVIDISSLSSAHRIVFRSNGGQDTIVGALRPQDVIEIPTGANPTDYAESDNGDGTRTLSNGDHSITFGGDAPTLVVGDHDDDDDDDDDHGGSDDDGNDDSCGSGDGSGSGDGDGTPLPVAARTLVGTAASDVLIGGAVGDILLGGASADILSGDAGDDVLRGEDGDDVLSGGDGNDVASGGAGDDEIHGGAGADMLFGNSGADLIYGDAGNDIIEGGAGSDRVWGGGGDDVVLATKGDGDDSYWGGDGNDTLDYSVATGNLKVDLGNGFMGRGHVVGAETGNDTIYGFENVIGGSGHDQITASTAVNIMDGGLGDDVFRFTSVAAADGDTIYGFAPGDRIDFSAIDANTGQAGKQAFTLSSGTTLSGAGQIVVTHETRDGADVTVIRGSVDAGPDAEFSLTLDGTHNLKLADFNGVS
ncbi:peroxidase family protein [Ensifer sp.]|jgi:Ca2+-binding RTX toxin-like protein|uniref:peroxidase family protein n=1 Tax=Ensifer sp. TaxID=1872086 RepID=UPI002E15DA43|nr:peroxidase family protein [Ensifer sp.]